MRKLNVKTLAAVILLTLPVLCFAQQGKDGARTINSSVNVNEYTYLVADANAGSSTLFVSNSTLNSNGYFSGPLAPGDLIYVIQIQGASMGLNNDSTYGNINVYNNCGKNEFVQVSSIPNSSTIFLDCGLKNSYTSSGRVQVVRVPRWTSLTINSGGVLTCPNWNGTTGGIVAAEVLGNTIINSGGTINVTGKGFRGGALDNLSQFGTGDYRWHLPESGAEKGEGIAGSQSDYDNFSGRYGRGAPSNGGGGGNGHTSGGGGGANAGIISSWNGHGVPDVSTGSWAQAWNLEWTGFASNNSSGGGRGGYSYSSDDRNALVEGPGNTNWGGDFRRNVGGVGGRPMDYSTGKLFFGGGGGAGDQNQNKGGAGANGGGMVYIHSFGTISGNGLISANGSVGQSTPARGTDGAGGGGGGGTVVLNSSGAVSGIGINANGGNGGNQIIRNIFEPTEAEGTGGGGGGGYIAISSGNPGRTATGANNGVTDSGGLLEFPPNGATKGGTGLPNETISNYYLTGLGDSICPNTQASLSAAIVGTAPSGITYYWYTVATGGTSVATGANYTTPPLSSSTTYYVEICPGFYRIPVQVVVVPNPAPSFTATSVCLGNATVFTNNTTGGISYSWNFGDGNNSTQANPSHTYGTSGSFVVVLTATNSSGCTASVTQNVTVGTTPQVSFTTAGPTTSCGPMTVNFTNNTTGGGANTYAWNFGDGGTSSQQNPSHTYSNPGTYTVTLSATIGTCNDIDSIVNYITIHPVPVASFTSNTVCLGSPMTFTNTTTGGTSYNWNFGDGGTSTSTNPSHTYATANTFVVTMIASNGTCTDTVTQNVVVSNAPQVSFSSAGPTTGCGSLTVNFVNSTTGGGGNSYLWSFGDGGTSASSNPTHTYSSPGTYTVILSAWLGTCNDADSIVNYITVNPAPTAAFNAANVCLGDVMSFTNTSAGATSYSWNFGDGGTSTASNPTHTYATANTFTVTMIASNGVCNDTIIQSVIVNNAPQVSFTTNGATSGCGSLTVNFVNNTTGGGGNSYSWDFGDGSAASSQQNPSHTYTTPGTYTVTLDASLGTCNDADSIVNYITVNPAPTAAFSATTVCLGDVTSFTNSSTGATGYTWDFGDGTGTSAASSPSYTYTTANTFTVTMIATDGTCTDTVTQSVVVSNAPQVSFTTNGATTGCGSLTVNFVNNTTGGGGNTYTWNFGDGSPVSSVQNPVYTYTTPGTYTVTLDASLGSCSDVDSIVNYITVNPQPTAAFTAADVCLGDVVSFNNTSAGATGYNWDFGDGTGTSTAASPSYTYSTANTFTVTLIVSDGTCSDTLTQDVVVSNAPQVSFTTNGATTGCGSLTVSFVNNTTGGGGNNYTWDFGDGSPTSSTQNPVYTYTTPGTYTVTLDASLGSCSDADSIVNYITVNPQPTAAFSASNVCLGDVMNFTNASSGATGYSWDFGDGTGTSSAASPAYTYSTANTFTVTLIATDGTCSDTITQQVVVNTAPQISFTSTGATTGCGSVTLNFINNTTGGSSNSYNWNFGDGGSSTLQDPVYTFTTPGTFTVTLTATIGSCTDTDSLVNYVTVTPGPVASFTAGSVCLGETVNFINTSTGATSYLWDFGDGTATSTQQNPTHVYNLGNTYTIILISSDGICSDTVTQTVTVNPPPQVNFTANATSACDSLTVTFTNNTTGAATYEWDFGDGFFSTDINPVHTYNVPGVYSVTLNGILGICISSQTSVNMISIYETPQTTVTASQNTICPNDCVNFTTTSTGSPTSWNWNFPGASTLISSAENPQNICYPVVGSYNVVLSVTNGNCSSNQTLTGFITVNTCTSPVAGFFSNDTILCKGSCINFTSTSQNANAYLWQFPGATPPSSTLPNPNNICYPSSGFYDVTLIVSNGIDSDTLTVTNFIQVTTPPVPPTFTQNGDTLTSSAAVTYQWYYGGFQIFGATNQTHIAQVSGNYSVTTTDANGCSSTSQQSWISLIGIDELDDATLVYLYPNPVQSQLTILIETSRRPELHYELRDAIGKRIYAEDFVPVQSPFKKVLDMSTLAPGIYFISIESADARLVRKIVKQ